MLTYPLFFYCLAVAMAFIFYYLSRYLFYKDESENWGLVAISSSLANVGYFGLPVTIMIFGQDILGTAVLIILGLGIHESSTGF